MTQDKQKYLLPILTVLLLLCPLVIVIAGNVSPTVLLDKEFDLKNTGKIVIRNTYGSIDVKNHNKNSIHIQVSFVIDGVQGNELSEIIEDVHIIAENVLGIITLESSIEGKAERFVQKLDGYDISEFDIHFEVYMPVSFACEIQLKYGQIDIESLLCLQSLKLQYGSLTAQALESPNRKPLAIVELAYSKANITNCKWLQLNLKYSKLEIEKSEALIAQTHYSKLFIQEGSSLVSESRYDTYRLGRLSNFVTEADYSHISIDEIGHKCLLETDYTDVKIAMVLPGFELVEVVNSYGSIVLNIDPEASYQLTADTKYCKIGFPNPHKISKETNGNHTHIEAEIGIKGSERKVKIESKYGNVKINP